MSKHPEGARDFPFRTIDQAVFPETPRMTAEDVDAINATLQHGYLVQDGLLRRILATYHAIAAMTAARDECERQFQRQTERVLELMNEIDGLSARLAASQQEVERLKCRHSDAWEEIAKLRAQVAAASSPPQQWEETVRAMDVRGDLVFTSQGAFSDSVLTKCGRCHNYFGRGVLHVCDTAATVPLERTR